MATENGGDVVSRRRSKKPQEAHSRIGESPRRYLVRHYPFVRPRRSQQRGRKARGPFDPSAPGPQVPNAADRGAVGADQIVVKAFAVRAPGIPGGTRLSETRRGTISIRLIMHNDSIPARLARSPLHARQFIAVALCCLINMADGFDLLSLALAPHLTREWASRLPRRASPSAPPRSDSFWVHVSCRRLPIGSFADDR